jgi:molybdopterin-guanine dinucleotide biosynthesis protein A
VLVELETLRQFVGDSLVQAGRQQATERHLCHDRLMEAPTTGAAIVAGGRARRFEGQDKSRLVVDGRSIIVRQLAVLQQVATEITVVGGQPGRFADLGVREQPDRLTGYGAIGGIHTAVETTSSDRVLVVACDLPFLEAGLLRRLVELSAGRDGAWVSTSRGVEPLLACYRRAAGPAIRGAIEAGRLRASDLGRVLDMASLGGAELDRFGPAERLLANVNTPADYARVQYRPS